MKFIITIICYEGDYLWVKNTVIAAKDCFMRDKLLTATKECDNCGYDYQRLDVERSIY